MVPPMIRQATIEDLPKMERAAREFSATSKFVKDLDFERFLGNWTELMNSGIAVIFSAFDSNLNIVGGIGGIAIPDLNSGKLTASELFWFVRRDQRGNGMRLYKEFEKWARERGCKAVQMVHLLDSMEDRLPQVYDRLGFEPVEVHYQKELT